MVATLPDTEGQHWSVDEGTTGVVVRAPNWVAALGRAFAARQQPFPQARLAAEVLPNGVVIANLLGTGRRMVVRRL